MKRKAGTIRPTEPKQKWDAARMARINKLLDNAKPAYEMRPHARVVEVSEIDEALELAALVAETATYKTYMMWDQDCIDPVLAPIPHREEIAAMIRKLKQSAPGLSNEDWNAVLDEYSKKHQGNRRIGE